MYVDIAVKQTDINFGNVDIHCQCQAMRWTLLARGHFFRQNYSERRMGVKCFRKPEYPRTITLSDP